MDDRAGHPSEASVARQLSPPAGRHAPALPGSQLAPPSPADRGRFGTRPGRGAGGRDNVLGPRGGGSCVCHV